MCISGRFDQFLEYCPRLVYVWLSSIPLSCTYAVGRSGNGGGWWQCVVKGASEAVRQNSQYKSQSNTFVSCASAQSSRRDTIRSSISSAYHVNVCSTYRSLGLV